MAAIGFLRLLLELRSIFIQDSVLLRQVMPEHLIFNHPFFGSPGFKAFEETMLRSLAADQSPAEQRLQTVMPFLTEMISNGFSSTTQQLSNQHHQIGKVDRQIQTLAHAFADIMFGRVEISSSTRLQAHLPGQGEVNCSFG